MAYIYNKSCTKSTVDITQQELYIRAMESKETQALRRAVEAVEGQTALARLLSEKTGKNVKQAHVWNWLFRDKRTPAEFAFPIEQVTGGKVKRYEIRPDLYPQETA